MKPFKKAHRITEDKRKIKNFPQIAFGIFFYPQIVMRKLSQTDLFNQI